MADPGNVHQVPRQAPLFRPVFFSLNQNPEQKYNRYRVSDPKEDHAQNVEDVFYSINNDEAY